MDKVTFAEKLELEDIKELVENIILHPNRFMIEELLKFKEIYKENINRKEISKKQKKYYCNIIDNPELLNEDEQDKISIQSDIPNFIDEPILSGLVTFNTQENTLSEMDKRLLSSDYPNYPCIDVSNVNNNFKLLANKIAYY